MNSDDGSPISGDDAKLGVLLMRTWDDGEAAMIRQLLASYSIPCQVVSDVPHTVWPLSVDGLGEVRILVAPAQLEEARTLLAEHRREGLEIVDGGAEPAAQGEE